jgi:hypothetical protein
MVYSSTQSHLKAQQAAAHAKQSAVTKTIASSAAASSASTPRPPELKVQTQTRKGSKVEKESTPTSAISARGKMVRRKSRQTGSPEA